MTVVCSCGVPDCRELGWPHEWDPIAAGDTCTITPPPAFTVLTIGESDVRVHEWPYSNHRVREPYVRWGSGYSCVECVEIHGDQFFGFVG